MGVLPDDVLNEILGSGNELTRVITVTPHGGEPVEVRAYILTNHADGYNVDVDQTIMTVVQSALPPITERGAQIDYDGKLFTIAEMHPDEAGTVNIIVRQIV